jgi:NADH dehydrogenase
MTSLVTVFGGSGFLGRHTVRALAKAGYRIRVGVRHPNLGNFLLPMGSVGQIQVVKVNVEDADQIAAALRGADVVINLVGILYETGHQRFEALHAEAAGAIATAAKSAGASTLIHVSSLYCPPDSDSAYARTKADGEARVRAAFPEATVLKPSIVFGPEDNFFNRFAALMRLLPPFVPMPLIGGGKTKFQPVYVSDVAAAIVKCAQDPATRGRLYELGGPSVYTFKELMELILRETCRKRLLVPVPFAIAMLQATFLQLLPKPLLTRDQVRLLKYDNVVSEGALTLADLGIQPDSLEAILPAYLWRFRAEGQFGDFVQDKIAAAPKS